MSPEEAVDILSGLTFRPGWDVVAYTVPGAVVLRTGTREPDVEQFLRDGRTVLIDVILTESIEDEALRDMTRDQLLRWAFDVFVRRAVHEVEEWLRFRGTPVFSPHPGRVPGLLGPGSTTVT